MLELAAEDLEQTIEELALGISGHRRLTLFGTNVYDISDPDGHLIRLGRRGSSTRSRVPAAGAHDCLDHDAGLARFPNG